MNASKLLDVECLEQFSFERSKMWGEFLKVVETVEDNREIKFDDVDKIFTDDGGDENDSNDGASLEEGIEDEDVLQDITNRNTSKISFLLHSQSKISAMVRSRAVSLVEKVEDDDDDESETERQNILNQTKPIFEEHERKWKEAGLDLVLNTFDPQKIEEKVGGWLRRNHSMATSQGYSPLTPYPQLTYQNTPHVSITKSQKCCARDNNNDSDKDSLHSVDTARYIRSSRKRLENRRRYFDPYSAASSMTIKTFRMVQSKREALREKYACLDRDEPVHSGKTYERHPPRCMQCTHRSSQVALSTELFSLKHNTGRVRRHCRRKCLRKRRHSSSFTATSSALSSEDESGEDARFMGRSALQRPRYYRQRHPQRWVTRYARDYRNLSLSALAHPMKVVSRTYDCSSNDDSSFDEMPRRTKRNSFEKRLCKRESDCACHNDVKLCKKTLHIADTSTEDWVVEDCSTPQKKQNPMYTQMLTHTAPAKIRKQRKATKRLYPKIEEDGEQLKSERKNLEKLKENNDNDKERVTQPEVGNEKDAATKSIAKNKRGKTSEGKVKQEQPKVSKSATNIKQKTKSKPASQLKNENSSDMDTEFSKQLQMALAKSLETFEEEQKKSNKIYESADTSDQSGTNMQKEKVKSKMGRLTERQLSLDSIISQGSTYSLSDERSDCSSLNILKPQPRFAKLRKLSKLMTDGNTFLSSSKNICNSTALNGDTAAQRQIMADRNKLSTIQEVSTITNCAIAATGTATARASKKIKRARAKPSPNVSSTKRNSPSTSTSSACSVSTVKSSKRDDDQIIVTSSTDVPVSKEARQKGLIPVEQTAKGILLYAPNRSNLAPAHSVVDGFFHVTFEHLSSVIGEKAAGKFMKYYLGRRRFVSSSSVYYRPPKSLMLSICAETDSDDDVLESVGQYGELYESPNKCDEKN